eukprot:6821876-Pyramimonas_sp.AAC.1
MAVLMASRCTSCMEATFSTSTSMVTSGLLLLARYQAAGAVKKWEDCAPARPSLPACAPAADRLLHGGPATTRRVLPCSSEPKCFSQR